MCKHTHVGHMTPTPINSMTSRTPIESQRSSKLDKIYHNYELFFDFHKYYENSEFCGLVRKTSEALPGGPSWLFDHFEYLKCPSCYCLRHGICLESLSLNILGAVMLSLSLVDQIKNSKIFQILPFFHFFSKLRHFVAHTTYF